jgi:hypothetical protein
MRGGQPLLLVEIAPCGRASEGGAHRENCDVQANGRGHGHFRYDQVLTRVELFYVRPVMKLENSGPPLTLAPNVPLCVA